MAQTRLALISGWLKPLLEERILYCYLFIFIFVRWLKYARVEISDNLNCFNSFGRNFHMFFFLFHLARTCFWSHISPEWNYGLLSFSPSVCLSHFSGSCDNLKNSSYFLWNLKLDRWQYGDLMHVISFYSYIKKSWLLWQKNIQKNLTMVEPAGDIIAWQ